MTCCSWFTPNLFCHVSVKRVHFRKTTKLTLRKTKRHCKIKVVYRSGKDNFLNFYTQNKSFSLSYLIASFNLCFSVIVTDFIQIYIFRRLIYVRIRFKKSTVCSTTRFKVLVFKKNLS